MTPQSHFFVIAPIAVGREPELRARLDSMNALPGHARPDNALVPFAAFDTIHFAHFAIVDDQTLDDTTAYGGPRVSHRPGWRLPVKSTATSTRSSRRRPNARPRA